MFPVARVIKYEQEEDIYLYFINLFYNSLMNEDLQFYIFWAAIPVLLYCSGS